MKTFQLRVEISKNGKTVRQGRIRRKVINDEKKSHANSN